VKAFWFPPLALTCLISPADADCLATRDVCDFVFGQSDRRTIREQLRDPAPLQQRYLRPAQRPALPEPYYEFVPEDDAELGGIEPISPQERRSNSGQSSAAHGSPDVERAGISSAPLLRLRRSCSRRGCARLPRFVTRGHARSTEVHGLAFYTTLCKLQKTDGLRPAVRSSQSGARNDRKSEQSNEND
jgi:hypothetical protein